jgi:hypothetical protein
MPRSGSACAPCKCCHAHGSQALVINGPYVNPLRATCREQDAIESGLIKKVSLRKSDSGIIPADGDLVRACGLSWSL